MELEIDVASNDTDACLRCGVRLCRKPTGRPKVWCSPACRRLAYDERRAAENGAIAIRVIERVEQVSIDECLQRVIASPVACGKVIDTVAGLIEDGQIHQPKWSKALAANGRLFAAVRQANQRHRREEERYARRR